LKATKAMVRGKSLGSDGVVIKFYMWGFGCDRDKIC
jgi:hypothetical protein